MAQTRRSIITSDVLGSEVPEVNTAGAPEKVTETVVAHNTSSIEVTAIQQNNSLLAKENKRKALAHTYAKEKTLTVMVAPMYAAYFGRVMHIMINGISVAVPCNGKPYNIPETFASEVYRRLRAVNEQQQKQKRFADVGANFEKAPGELALY